MSADQNRPFRSREIRKANERIILKILHERGTASQSEIVETTGLQASTVFRIFTALERAHLIRHSRAVAEVSTRIGRRPKYYELVPESKTAIGAEIAGTAVTVVVTGFDGSVLHHESVSSTPDMHAREVIETLTTSVRRSITAASITMQSIVGIAVGAPGVIDIESGTVLEYGRFDGMHGSQIGRMLEDSFHVPIHLHNNAALIAYGEYRFGVIHGARSLIAFLLRSGDGGAYITDGRIAVSQGRSVFEIGHQHPELSSIRAGRTESATVLEDYLGEQPLLNRVSAAVPNIDSWDRLIAALDAGSPEVQIALEEPADLLAAAARNMALLLSPEAFMVITRFIQLSEFFARRIEKLFEDVPDVIRLGVKHVIPVAYDSVRAGRGAAEFAFERYFEEAESFR